MAILVFSHVLICSSFTLIYLIAKAGGALPAKGMGLYPLGTNLWKLPGTCSTNPEFLLRFSRYAFDTSLAHMCHGL